MRRGRGPGHAPGTDQGWVSAATLEVTEQTRCLCPLTCSLTGGTSGGGAAPHSSRAAGTGGRPAAGSGGAGRQYQAGAVGWSSGQQQGGRQAAKEGWWGAGVLPRALSATGPVGCAPCPCSSCGLPAPGALFLPRRAWLRARCKCYSKRCCCQSLSCLFGEECWRVCGAARPSSVMLWDWKHGRGGTKPSRLAMTNKGAHGKQLVKRRKGRSKSLRRPKRWGGNTLALAGRYNYSTHGPRGRDCLKGISASKSESGGGGRSLPRSRRPPAHYHHCRGGRPGEHWRARGTRGARRLGRSQHSEEEPNQNSRRRVSGCAQKEYWGR